MRYGVHKKYERDARYLCDVSIPVWDLTAVSKISRMSEQWKRTTSCCWMNGAKTPKLASSSVFLLITPPPPVEMHNTTITLQSRYIDIYLYFPNEIYLQGQGRSGLIFFSRGISIQHEVSAARQNAKNAETLALNWARFSIKYGHAGNNNIIGHNLRSNDGLMLALKLCHGRLSFFYQFICFNKTDVFQFYV